MALLAGVVTLPSWGGVSIVTVDPSLVNRGLLGVSAKSLVAGLSK
jgi:hypothetical protein